MSEARKRDSAVFDGAKIDRARVRSARQAETGQVGVDGFLSGRLRGTPAKAASKFLDENLELFGDEPEVLHELKVEQVSRSPAGYHVVFQQMRQGVPVEEAKISVHMTRDKRVHAAYSSLRPEVADLDVEEMAENGIDEQEAIQIATAAVEPERKAPKKAQAEHVTQAEEQTQAQQAIRTEKRARARKVIRAQEQVQAKQLIQTEEQGQAKQVILAEEEPRLAWKVLVSTLKPRAEWAVWVDVQNGEVLQRRELSLAED